MHSPLSPISPISKAIPFRFLDRAEFKRTCLCAATVVALILLTWPFGGLPFDDDFSYTFTAKRLAETGHMTFNGWATVALVPQAYWGALFIKLFGFSFTVVRLSILPVASACGSMAYLLARRCGIRPNLALLSTMTLIASPMFVTLSASFMTDVSGLLFMLAILCCVVSALNESRSQITWIVSAVVLTLVGGMVRQTVWAVAVTGLPYITWTFRKDRRLAAISLGSFIVTLVGIVVTNRWLYAQPYIIPEYSVSVISRHVLLHPYELPINMIGLIFTYVLSSAPILIVSFAATRRARLWHYSAGASAIVLLIATYACLTSHFTAPWIGNIITETGPLGVYELGVGRPQSLPKTVWFLLSIATFAIAAMTVASVVRYMATPGGRIRGLSQLTTARLDRAGTALLLVSGVYIVLILPRCAISMGFDRYLIPLIPLLGIPVLLLSQSSAQREWIGKGSAVIAWIVVGGYALFAVVNSNDLHALGRARSIAAEILQNAGVPRNAIDDGFEFDYWTQLMGWGYINEHRIVNPPDAYQAKYITSPITECPVFHPRYRVRFEAADPAPGERAAGFAPISYFSLLPPFHHRLVIYELGS